MKIIKRNGSEAVFDITKIIAAITKANKVVPDAQRLTKQQIIEISDHVQEVCYARGHAMNVEEIQDIVEDAIMAKDEKNTDPQTHFRLCPVCGSRLYHPVYVHTACDHALCRKPGGTAAIPGICTDCIRLC